MLSFPSVFQSTKCSPVFITIAVAKQCYIDRYVRVNFQIWPIILRWTPVMDNPVCFYCLVHLFNQYQQSPCSPSSTTHDIHNNKDQLKSGRPSNSLSRLRRHLCLLSQPLGNSQAFWGECSDKMSTIKIPTDKIPND